MDNKTVFVKTIKGEEEMHGKTSSLFGDVKRALSMVDGSATVGELNKRAAPSLSPVLNEMLRELSKGEFIQDVAKHGQPMKMSIPARVSSALKKPGRDTSEDELDFTAAYRAPSPEILAAEAEKIKVARAKSEAEAKAHAEAEKRAKAEAEAARQQAAQEAEKVRAELAAARAKAEAEAKAHAEAEKRAKAEAEAARQQAAQEAEKVRTELAAARAKAEAEAKAHAEAEKRAKTEVEAARQQDAQKAEHMRAELAAARAKAEAEAKAHAEAEKRAKAEAEAARQQAEQEAEKVRAELAAARAKAEAEAKAHAEAEKRAKIEVEAARQQAEQEAVKARKELVAAKAKAEAEAKAHAEAEKRAKAEAEAARKQAEQEAEKVRAELAAARAKAEAEAKAHAEAEKRAKVEVEAARQQAEQEAAKVREELIAVRAEAEAKAKAHVEAEQRAKAEVEKRAKVEAEAARQQTEQEAAVVDRQDENPVKLQAGATRDVDAIQPANKADAVVLAPFDFSVSVVNSDVETIAVPENTDSKQEDQALIHDLNALGQAAKNPVPPDAASTVVSSTVEPVEQVSVTQKKTVVPESGAHLPSEAEVSKLAAAQAKAWAEAEQRAREEALHKAEFDTATASLEKNSRAPVARIRRKPLPWGKIGAGLFVVVLLSLFVVPFVLPMRGYANKLEKSLSLLLQQPVHIQQMSGRLLPTPRLVLNQLSIGDQKQVSVQQAQINFSVATLFADHKVIDYIDLQGLLIEGSALQSVTEWTQQIAAVPQHPVRRIQVSQGKIKAEGIVFSELGGLLDFNPQGKFVQAKLHSDANKFALEIKAEGDKKLQALITARNGALPLLPNWNFDELNAKGELSGDELSISDFDGRIAGGIIQGDAKINWRTGWQMQGKLIAKSITLQNINRLLEGDMYGSARFKMKSNNLQKLTDSVFFEGDFEVKKGMLSGVDVVETARLRSPENMPGGRTHFEELNGDLSYANGIYHFKRIKMTSGALNANSAVEVKNQELSGYVNAELTMRAGMGTVALRVGGTTEAPTLKVGR